MFGKELKREDYFIIATNLLPVIGAFFLGWTAQDIFIVYAMETLIVGAITVLKMATASFYKKNEPGSSKVTMGGKSGLFLIVFFILHFGIFALVQTALFTGASGIGDLGGPLGFFLQWPKLINKEIALLLAIFVISYIARDVFPFYLREEYKTTPLLKLMFQPYGRIMIQQLTVILGSLFLQFGWGAGFVLIFATVKIYFELAFNFNRYLEKAMEKNRSGKQ